MSKIWPSGDNKEVLSIKLNYKKFSIRYNIEFHHFTDDLGGYNAALILIQNIGHVAMREYDNTPVRGVIFNVDSLIPSAVAAQEIKNFFKLEDDDVAWIRVD
jgi:hypothetical protein